MRNLHVLQYIGNENGKLQNGFSRQNIDYKEVLDIWNTLLLHGTQKNTQRIVDIVTHLIEHGRWPA